MPGRRMVFRSRRIAQRPTPQRRDGFTLQRRIGLNSREVVAGEIGSGTAGYTAVVGEAGMAQRMESAAPQGRCDAQQIHYAFDRERRGTW
jgi:class 3 adenylate cyclase